MVAALAKVNDLEVPQDLVREYARQMAQPYMQAYKSKISGVMPMFMNMAESQLREMYVLDFFRKSMDVKLTDNEKEKFTLLNAQGMKMSLEDYQDKYKDSLADEDKYFAPALDNKIVDKIVKKMSVISPEAAAEATSGKSQPKAKATQKKEDN